MNTFTNIAIGIALIVAAIIIVPELKCACSTKRSEVVKTSAVEPTVSDFKAEYVDMHKNRMEILTSLYKFRTELQIAEKNLSLANEKKSIARQNVLSVGVYDATAFVQAKSAYEAICDEASDYAKLCMTYRDSIAKLETSLRRLNACMSKTRADVDSFEAKKSTATSIRKVNRSIEKVNCIDASTLAVASKQLDEDIARRSIKSDVLTSDDQLMSEIEMRAYINRLMWSSR